MKKHFSEYGPAAYALSVGKERLKRYCDWVLHAGKWATLQQPTDLPVVLCRHNSLIRRKLGDVDAQLQDNKAVNLGLAAPHIDGLLIRPGEVFSFWRLVGKPTKRKGYREGLVLKNARTDAGIGGGMCQFTNLLHWMVLHSPLTIVEHHHHNHYDLFPDYNRQIPFGTGTAIFYNYVDYQVMNTTDLTFQFRVGTSEAHLCGELRVDRTPPLSYHITEEDAGFVREGDGWYRENRIFRTGFDRLTGNPVFKELLLENHARVLYDASLIPPERVRPRSLIAPQKSS